VEEQGHLLQNMQEAMKSKPVVVPQPVTPQPVSALPAPPPPPVPVPPPPPPVAVPIAEPIVPAPVLEKKPVSEKQSYEAAYEWVRTKRYQEALPALEQFLVDFPNSTYVVNVLYWLGEVYWLQWQTHKTELPLLEKSRQAFMDIVTQHPDHIKVVDASLKIGFIDEDRGDIASAKQYFTEVKQRYPGTSAARVAEARLKRMSKGEYCECSWLKIII
jgi:tol-pal system protein YbgF